MWILVDSCRSPSIGTGGIALPPYFGGMSSKLLNQLDAKYLLGINSHDLNVLVRDKRIPHVELPNGEVRFIASEIWAWIDSHRREVQG